MGYMGHEKTTICTKIFILLFIYYGYVKCFIVYKYHIILIYCIVLFSGWVWQLGISYDTFV